MKRSEQPPQPDWLYRITYGLADSWKIRILLENDRYAVVQSPGGMWWDNSGGHYGAASYDLVDKRKLDTYRKGCGLLECKELQHGGRAKLAQWKKLIEAPDETPAPAPQPEPTAAPCKGGNGRSCSQDATDNCSMCGKDICTDHIGAEQPDDPTAIVCTDCD